EKTADPEARAKQERLALELDEFSRGYPRLTLSLLIDVVGACHAVADRPAREGGRSKKLLETDEDAGPDLRGFRPFNEGLRKPEGIASLRKRIHAANVSGNAIS